MSRYEQRMKPILDKLFNELEEMKPFTYEETEFIELHIARWIGEQIID